MGAAHQQVQEQRYDILIDAYNNPVEAYLEYQVDNDSDSSLYDPDPAKT